MSLIICVMLSDVKLQYLTCGPHRASRIFLLIRTCGRAENRILKHGIYFNCSGWEKAVLRRFYVYDTVTKEELSTVGMLEEENIEL